MNATAKAPNATVRRRCRMVLPSLGDPAPAVSHSAWVGVLRRPPDRPHGRRTWLLMPEISMGFSETRRNTQKCLQLLAPAGKAADSAYRHPHDSAWGRLILHW